MPRATVIVPVYNYAKHLRKTLQAIRDQTYKDFELIVVDDGSADSSPKVAKQLADTVLINEKNSGPAVTRNKGIDAAKGEIIVFTDSDCVPENDWLENMVKRFEDRSIDAVMGNTKIHKSTILGDSISALGFPGGANAGFERLWKVDENGFTDHITSCNFASRKQTFRRYGVFDESFPLAGGEDSEIGYRWAKKGVKLKYAIEALVYHEPRTSFISFWKWMVYRGRSNYHFKRKVGDVSGFIKLRAWSSWNIIKQNILDPKIILIVPLIFLSFVLQQIGYMIESRKR